MSENLDWPTGLWRLVVVNTAETDRTFITVLGENLPFREACEMAAPLEEGLNGSV